MIIVNGHLQKIEITGASFDELGVPQEATRTEGEEIPCNISGNRAKDNTTGDVSYTTATYEVLIDNASDFYADEVRLTNNRGSSLGLFRVQDLQYLDYVDAIKLTCIRYAD